MMMKTIQLNKSQWGLYDSATEKDVETMNRIANRAVLDVLFEMQKEAVNMDAAFNTSLGNAYAAIFYQLDRVGGYDTETLRTFERQLMQQFCFSHD